MKTSFCFWPASLIVLIAGNLFPAAAQEQAPDQALPSVYHEQELVQQLEQIRKQNGGGVAAVLSDLLPDEDVSKLFRDELRKVLQQNGKIAENPQQTPLPAAISTQRQGFPPIHTNPGNSYPYSGRPNSFDSPSGASPSGNHGFAFQSQDSRPPNQRPQQGNGPNRNVSPTHSSGDIPSNIRESAKRLESVAAVLEESGQFAEADEIRRICQQMRESVRPQRTGLHFTYEITR